MCYCVYVGANHDLPLIDWNAASPHFYATELPEDERAVALHFSKKCIRYLGSWQACSCGFNCDVTEEFFESVNSAICLRDYINSALQKEETVEFYTCWAGNQLREPEERIAQLIGELDIEREGLSLEENTFIVFRN